MSSPGYLLREYEGPHITNTFSIAARDRETGRMGVAVQSHYFSVGAIAPWALAGTGAAATQAYGGLDLGPDILALLEQGLHPKEVLDSVLQKASRPDLRQIAIVDAKGEVAAHTGENCTPAAGHLVGDGFSVQANVMLDESIWPAMKLGYESSRGNLAERLVASLEAGQAAGGDLRGQQSAAMLIVSGEKKENPRQGRILELRVEDHPQPIAELRRLIPLHAAHQLLNEARGLIIEGDFAKVAEIMEKAVDLAPEKTEHKFYLALGMYGKGEERRGLDMFREVFSKEPHWAILAPRLASRARMDPARLRRIAEQAPSP